VWNLTCAHVVPNVDYLSFAIESWDRLFGCRKAIMTRLARRHKLLLNGPPHYPRDIFHDGNRSEANGIIRRTDNFYTLTSNLHFRSERVPGLTRISKNYHIHKVRRALEKLKFGPLALVIWQPEFVDMLGNFGEQVSCYYVYDNFVDYVGQDEEERRHIEEDESRMLRMVDIVFTTGAGLFQAKNRYGNAVNVPNGVDFDLFSRALSPDTPIPADLSAIPEPRLGYVGTLNEKVNLELIEEIAARRPGWSFVFIGPEKLTLDAGIERFQSLRKRSNFYFLDRRPENELPGYFRGLDIGLMPYNLHSWAYFASPLKLHEYLAAGKPVISAPIPSAGQFRQVISMAHDPGEWIAAVEDALAHNDRETRAERVAVARANDWNTRIELIETTIANKIAEKQYVGKDLVDHTVGGVESSGPHATSAYGGVR